MTDWLLLLTDEVSPEDTLAALRASVPSPWKNVVILAVDQRWRPLKRSIAPTYGSERLRVLRDVWAEQEAAANARLQQVVTAVQPDARTVETHFAWGDPVAETHRLAREIDAAMIVCPVPAHRGPIQRLQDLWSGDLAQRLTHNAPCSVLLARPPMRAATGSPASPRPSMIAR
jgi:nucleotide-binding universal stress UspA family protein